MSSLQDSSAGKFLEIAGDFFRLPAFIYIPVIYVVGYLGDTKLSFEARKSKGTFALSSTKSGCHLQTFISLQFFLYELVKSITSVYPHIL